MANTTNQGWSKPTVGGSEDTWGATINTTLDAIDTLVGPITAAEIAKLDGLTSSTAELNKLTGATSTTAELNFVTGVTSSIQTQFNTIQGVPTGAIMLWSGAANAIPTGYVICDGNNSTPDLRNSFVLGAGDTYAVGATGGSADAIVPAHTHALTAASASTASLTGTFDTSKPNAATGIVSVAAANIGPAGDGAQYSGARYSIDASHSHALSGSTDSTGSSATNANLPPYYALCYIMKT